MKRVQSLCMLCESIIPFSNNEARDQLHAYNYVDNVLVVFFSLFHSTCTQTIYAA